MILVRKTDHIIIEGLELGTMFDHPTYKPEVVLVGIGSGHIPVLELRSGGVPERATGPRGDKPFIELDDAAIEAIVTEALQQIVDKHRAWMEKRERQAGPASLVPDIETIGIMLYGAGRWQTPLARDLGWSQALLTRICKGERPLTDAKRAEWRKHVVEAVKPKVDALQEAVAEVANRYAKESA